MAVHNTIALMVQEEVKKQCVESNKQLIRMMIAEALSNIKYHNFGNNSKVVTDNFESKLDNISYVKARTILDLLEKFALTIRPTPSNRVYDDSTMLGRLKWMSKDLLNEELVLD